jgi:SNARE protein
LDFRYPSENKRVDLLDGPSAEDCSGEENVLLASSKLQYYSLCEQNNVPSVKKMFVSIEKVTILQSM